MMLRTHLALTAGLVLLFLPHISDKLIFAGVAFIATILPDIDSAFSTAGRNIASRVLQAFTKHRGFIHSITLCAILAFILAYFWPVAALPFFVGYSFHIFLDSFTKEGVRAFWPYKKISSWHVRTSGRTETVLFLSFLIIDLLLLVLTIVRA